MGLLDGLDLDDRDDRAEGVARYTAANERWAALCAEHQDARVGAAVTDDPDVIAGAETLVADIEAAIALLKSAFKRALSRL